MTTIHPLARFVALRGLHRTLGAAAFAAVLALGAPVQAQPATTAEGSTTALESGKALVQAGRFAEAIPELETADQLAGGRSAEAAVALARAYAGAGAHARALDEARAALARDPAANVANEAHIVICQNRPEATENAPADAPRKVGDGVTRPQIIYRVSPQYPPDLRKARAQGTVVLDAVIDEDGCVSAARVLRGAAPGFDAAALAAVMQWVFRPAIADGQPVKVSYTLTTSFAVEDTPSRER